MRKASVNKVDLFVSIVSENQIRSTWGANFVFFLWSHCTALCRFPITLFVPLHVFHLEMSRIPKLAPMTLATELIKRRNSLKFAISCELAKNTTETKHKRSGHIWSCCFVHQWRSESALCGFEMPKINLVTRYIKIRRFSLSFGNYWSSTKTMENKIEKTF